MRKTIIVLLLLTSRAWAQQPDLSQYVNPLIGTQKMGHTYPGATVPFGSVQLSPDTDTIAMFTNGKYNPDMYKYCAGYNYDDKTIVGFSHTHFSGTGHSDLGDFLIMPTTGALQLNPGTKDHPENGFRSVFSHSTEVAKPDYYKVRLEDDNILAELTTTTRVGFHKYTFPKSDSAHIILDLMHGIYNYDDKNTWTFLRIENDTLVTGYRQTAGWARTRTVYFALSFSKPFTSYGNKNFKNPQYSGFWRRFNQSRNFPEIAGEQIRAYFDFKTNEGEAIMLKFALSPVSTANALENLRTETPGWNFEEVYQKGKAQWNSELSKIAITTKDPNEKINFYTAMYHAFISPTVYMDVNGSYKGLDQNVHQADGFTNYTTFSLWDTYRALHPLFTIVQPKRNNDMIRSMLAHYDQSAEGMLPIWSHYANENWCMSGYHSVAVIADAIIKGDTGINARKALDACVQTAHKGFYDGLDYYMKLGYVPEDKKGGTSVSTTLEFAFDDWCIAQLAKKLGDEKVYEEFNKRSQNWRNVYDNSIGFMRPRLSDGSFRKNFDVLSTNNQGFIEGNAWNFSLFVPQDPKGLIQSMGGNRRFVPHLDSLFTMHLPDHFFEETEDITREGIIGGYVHGNEPSHHVAYLYNYTDQPWKTQERIRMILKKQYGATPDGLGGNDDCGQMSAWYIFSSIGFYPVTPGSGEYQLGSPAVDKAVIQLENGKSFTIEARNQSDKNVYVQKVVLNGVELNRLYITQQDILKGGTLQFFMGSKPNKKRLPNS
ncbi:GH92 family glycosyl hydrolase [Flavisolibacter ginsengisoli]|jgi:predicted alpha-1,2-mannosidase|uniref:Alpha-1,2-mannosidase, putative n=1 Tax=Flavisolibacter ginsengisoli DSM 18119 TaxID=1121884 RepID=A0A1M4ZH36_9BACT|nr:GH92 family glycosyl hydrolase [Flavisolibacter ginsengisoli]SHF17353.1 alpha-1,2-mannosidase, putative [Flavisolibacter ginsengisoli DSM 18119]